MSRATNAQKYDASSKIPEPYPSGFTVVSARRRAFPFVAGCGPGLLGEIMAGGFTKLFSDIVDSSIWDRDSDTCKVWVTLLALSNGDGYIRGSVSWLAKKARVSIEKCQSAVEEFSKPDPYSRTPDNDGRRIEVLEDGFLILNYLLFRERLSSNPTAAKTRERVRKHRERYTALRNAQSVTSVTLPLYSASGVQGKEEEGTGEGGQPKVVNARTLTIPRTVAEVEAWADFDPNLQKDQAQEFFDHFEASGWKDKNGNWIVDARAKFRSWCRNGKRYEEEKEGKGFWKVNEQLKLCEEEIRAIQARAIETPLETKIQERDVKRFAELKKRRKELKEQLEKL